MLTLAAVIVFVPTNDGDTGPDLRLALNMMLIAIARTVRDYRPNRRVYFGKPWGRRLHSPRKGGSGLRRQSSPAVALQESPITAVQCLLVHGYIIDPCTDSRL